MSLGCIVASVSEVSGVSRRPMAIQAAAPAAVPADGRLDMFIGRWCCSRSPEVEAVHRSCVQKSKPVLLTRWMSIECWSCFPRAPSSCGVRVERCGVAVDTHIDDLVSAETTTTITSMADILAVRLLVMHLCSPISLFGSSAHPTRPNELSFLDMFFV